MEIPFLRNSTYAPMITIRKLIAVSRLIPSSPPRSLNNGM